MKHRITQLVSMVAVLALVLVWAPATVFAEDTCTNQALHPELNLCPLPRPQTGDNSLLTTVLSFAFAVMAIISVLIITIAGFRYVISRGDPQSMAKAKNTILYAIIGLAVAVSAQLLVQFVIGRATG